MLSTQRCLSFKDFILRYTGNSMTETAPTVDRRLVTPFTADSSTESEGHRCRRGGQASRIIIDFCPQTKQKVLITSCDVKRWYKRRRQRNIGDREEERTGMGDDIFIFI